ncbi:putative glyoxylase family protein [Tetragenococcus muriaticus PMC-11-5]|uniref:Putative glyoxylase family protein n=1 Tax=Tetragenococcus muriaticus PMC-11-5 TaxID=1302649 RepID=A0A091C1K7_9ENTE|nr:VOC family protein [Tetragenococcus muriaticus]KFN90610.1 putative glyoxylase family protein [Tetragenococcus muriaticus PMC-11-5]
MKVEHIAIWVKDLEKMKAFYKKYFNIRSSDLYHNEKTGFRSYFLNFEEGSRIELTTKQHLANRVPESFGYAHMAIAVGDRKAVDTFAEKFVEDGFPLLSGPRTTGDGYYEAVIQDPEGNLIELTTE